MGTRRRDPIQIELKGVLPALKLEVECPSCRGTGDNPEKGWGNCNCCKGSGVEVTDEGQAILDFLRENLSLGVVK